MLFVSVALVKMGTRPFVDVLPGCMGARAKEND